MQKPTIRRRARTRAAACLLAAVGSVILPASSAEAEQGQASGDVYFALQRLAEVSEGSAAEHRRQNVLRAKLPPVGPEAVSPPRPLPVDKDDREVDVTLRSMLRPISQVGTNIRPTEPGDLPTDYGKRLFAAQGTIHYPSQYAIQPLRSPDQWQLAPFCHRPLYFEEVRLERYGDSHGIFQPGISAARFFTNIPLLPYKMAKNPPGICILPEAEYWPGYFTECETCWPPVRLDAAAVQAGAITGLIFLLP